MSRQRRPVNTLLLLLISGCGLDPVYFTQFDTGPLGDSEADADADADSDADADTDTDADSDPIELTSIDPATGLSTGGTRVTLTGAGFSSDTTVKFGTKKATITSSTSTHLVVETPSQTTAGAYDVVVEDPNTGDDTLSNAFTYYLDGTGKYGVVGSFTYLDYVGAGWQSDADSGTAFMLVLADPSAHSYWENFAPTMDTCRSNYSPTFQYSVVAPASAPAISIANASGDSVNLTYDSTGNAWSKSPFTSTSFAFNDNYDVTIPDLDGFPASVINNGVTTPGSFRVTSPNLDGAQVPSTTKNNLSLSWTGSGGDYMIASMSLYSINDTTLSNELERVTCVISDDGSFPVPANVWTRWAANEIVVIEFSRISVSRGIIGFNNATSGVVGSYDIVSIIIAN